MAKTIICFDVDGTLADTTDAQVEAFNLAFEKNNLPKKRKEDITQFFGLPALAIVKQLFPKVGLRKIKGIIEDKKVFFTKQTYKQVAEIDNTKEALALLKKKYYLALNTNGLHDEAVKIIKAAGINQKLFDIIIGEDEVAHPKPSSDEIKLAEKKLNAKVEFVVGDTVFDMRAGKLAGVKTIAVLCGLHDLNSLSKENPTMIVQDVGVLADILLETL